jgi:hypothetical protein
MPNECAAPLGAGIVANCGLSGSAKIHVLVQKGKALGATVTVTPAHPDFVRCVRKEIAAATWKSVPGATSCIRTYTAK